jgi:hypothetical protein
MPARRQTRATIRHSACELAGSFGFFKAARTLELRHPLLDLNGEHVVVQLGLQPFERRPELVNNVRREWEVEPVLAFAKDAKSSPHHVEVGPAAHPNFCTA